VRPVGAFVPTNDLFLLLSGSRSVPINLSKATRLKDVTFRLDSWRAKWIPIALQTSITFEHRDPRQITIFMSYHLATTPVGRNTVRAFGESVGGQRVGLNRILLQLREWRSFTQWSSSQQVRARFVVAQGWFSSRLEIPGDDVHWRGYWWPCGGSLPWTLRSVGEGGPESAVRDSSAMSLLPAGLSVHTSSPTYREPWCRNMALTVRATPPTKNQMLSVPESEEIMG
jgi:hypothetical protein